MTAPNALLPKKTMEYSTGDPDGSGKKAPEGVLDMIPSGDLLLLIANRPLRRHYIGREQIFRDPFRLEYPLLSRPGLPQRARVGGYVPFELHPWCYAFGHGLKYFKCDDAPFDSRIWEKIGPTLEVLIVNKVLGSTLTIEAIQRFCRMLRHIDVNLGYCERGAWYSLLTSYGARLEFATILDTENKYVVPLLHSCKNARFAVYVGCPSY